MVELEKSPFKVAAPGTPGEAAASASGDVPGQMVLVRDKSATETHAMRLYQGVS